MFQVQFSNLTAGQPMSPLVAVVHDSGFSLFNIGQPASVGLEHLSEGGETAPLVTLASSDPGYMGSAVGAGGTPPGGTAMVSFSVVQANLPTAQLSLATMLVNSNDAFAALKAESLSAMTVGASVSLDVLSYDAGTEAHSESAATVPGMAGVGFNAARDDVRNAVHLHPGVITADDGLSGSALTAAHRWDNPVARVTITRTQ